MPTYVERFHRALKAGVPARRRSLLLVLAILLGFAVGLVTANGDQQGSPSMTVYAEEGSAPPALYRPCTRTVSEGCSGWGRVGSCDYCEYKEGRTCRVCEIDDCAGTKHCWIEWEERCVWNGRCIRAG